MKTRPDPDQLLQWVVHDGVPPSQIGARLGVSRATGYEWLRRYAIRPDSPAVGQDELLATWRAGPESAERVADETGLPAEAVAERLITAGAITSTRPYVLVGALADPLPGDQLRQWHVDEGRTAAQIATMTGTTVRQVRYRLGQYGLTKRRADPHGRTPPPADTSLADRLRDTLEAREAAAATTADTLSMLTETVRRLRVTTQEARQAVQQAALERSRSAEASAARRSLS
jgi:hypothetical protein